MNSDPFNDEPPETSKDTDFFASGSPSCRFNNVGDTHQGEIVTFEEAQQRDIKTGELANWPDGNPKMMLVITLQTTERDKEIDDDDGQRRLYVNKPSGMFAAIKSAIGKNKFAKGAKLAVKYTGNGKPTTPGFNPPKEYAARYTPPGNGDMPATRPQMTPMKEAWDAFRKIYPTKTADQLATEWKSLIADTFPGKPKDLMVAKDWESIRLKIESGIATESGILDPSEIPF